MNRSPDRVAHLRALYNVLHSNGLQATMVGQSVMKRSISKQLRAQRIRLAILKVSYKSPTKKETL